jgi:hypothetical protein
MVRMMKRIFFLILICTSSLLKAQEKPLDMKMDFEDYEPPSTLVVEEHHIKRSKFPFIDIHNHQGNMNTADLKGLVGEMGWDALISLHVGSASFFVVIPVRRCHVDASGLHLNPTHAACLP